MLKGKTGIITQVEYFVVVAGRGHEAAVGGHRKRKPKGP